MSKAKETPQKPQQQHPGYTENTGGCRTPEHEGTTHSARQAFGPRDTYFDRPKDARQRVKNGSRSVERRIELDFVVLGRVGRRRKNPAGTQGLLEREHNNSKSEGKSARAREELVLNKMAFHGMHTRNHVK